jgi:hypothetical protein
VVSENIFNKKLINWQSVNVYGAFRGKNIFASGCFWVQKVALCWVLTIFVRHGNNIRAD